MSLRDKVEQFSFLPSPSFPDQSSINDVVENIFGGHPTPAEIYYLIKSIQDGLLLDQPNVPLLAAILNPGQHAERTQGGMVTGDAELLECLIISLFPSGLPINGSPSKSKNLSTDQFEVQTTIDFPKRFREHFPRLSDTTDLVTVLNDEQEVSALEDSKTIDNFDGTFGNHFPIITIKNISDIVEKSWLSYKTKSCLAVLSLFQPIGLEVKYQADTKRCYGYLHHTLAPMFNHRRLQETRWSPVVSFVCDGKNESKDTSLGENKFVVHFGKAVFKNNKKFDEPVIDSLLADTPDEVAASFCSGKYVLEPLSTNDVNDCYVALFGAKPDQLFVGYDQDSMIMEFSDKLTAVILLDKLSEYLSKEFEYFKSITCYQRFFDFVNQAVYRKYQSRWKFPSRLRSPPYVVHASRLMLRTVLPVQLVCSCVEGGTRNFSYLLATAGISNQGGFRNHNQRQTNVLEFAPNLEKLSCLLPMHIILYPEDSANAVSKFNMISQKAQASIQNTQLVTHSDFGIRYVEYKQQYIFVFKNPYGGEKQGNLFTPPELSPYWPPEDREFVERKICRFWSPNTDAKQIDKLIVNKESLFIILYNLWMKRSLRHFYEYLLKNNYSDQLFTHYEKSVNQALKRHNEEQNREWSPEVYLSFKTQSIHHKVAYPMTIFDVMAILCACSFYRCENAVYNPPTYQNHRTNNGDYDWAFKAMKKLIMRNARKRIKTRESHTYALIPLDGTHASIYFQGGDCLSREELYTVSFRAPMLMTTSYITNLITRNSTFVKFIN